MLMKDQFGISQNLQTSPVPQTSFLVWTFFAVSYSKTALIELPYFFGDGTKFMNETNFITIILLQFYYIFLGFLP